MPPEFIPGSQSWYSATFLTLFLETARDPYEMRCCIYCDKVLMVIGKFLCFQQISSSAIIDQKCCKLPGILIWDGAKLLRAIFQRCLLAKSIEWSPVYRTRNHWSKIRITLSENFSVWQVIWHADSFLWIQNCPLHCWHSFRLGTTKGSNLIQEKWPLEEWLNFAWARVLLSPRCPAESQSTKTCKRVPSAGNQEGLVQK